MFSELEKRPATNHDLPAIHHNFTTKTPHKTSFFRKNPRKNALPPHHKEISSKQKKAARQPPNRSCF
jgi:hypothetical protein